MRVVYQYIKKRVQEALKGTTRFLRRKPEQKKKRPSMKTVFVLLVQRLQQLASLIHHFDAFLDFILILIINH
jgi:hypothetical protein